MSAVTFHLYSVMEAVLLSLSTPSFVFRDVCDYFHLSAVNPGEITQQVCIVSLALMNIHTCKGRLIFPQSLDGGRVVGTFLSSCLLKEGNLRVIL